jgi:hypothetical protein
LIDEARMKNNKSFIAWPLWQIKIDVVVTSVFTL